jgi:DNA polymerase
MLIVGDFSSVESRGLAWQACEQWKIDAYQQGLDLYKVLATRIYPVEYDEVLKPQRQVGKTGELSCGYGAGGGAVHTFAKNMGVTMTEAEAVALVRDWRAANPAIVDWWRRLHDALLGAMETSKHTVSMPWGHVVVTRQPAPLSLQAMGVEDSLMVEFQTTGLQFTRFIHGVQVRGRNLTYYKPSERKTGKLWTDYFTDPKTGQLKQFTVYGGKLAGLLTQSLCREVFFRSLRLLTTEIEKQGIRNVRVIGQFHDELVMEWWPAAGGVSHDAAVALLERCMTETSLQGFPLAAEIKSAHRYVK